MIKANVYCNEYLYDYRTSNERSMYAELCCAYVLASRTRAAQHKTQPCVHTLLKKDRYWVQGQSSLPDWPYNGKACFDITPEVL